MTQEVFSFNSTMVRLKDCSFRHYRHTILLFQFHNGSIKSNQSPPPAQAQPAFQFHNGSIKSQACLGQSPSSPLFQFHNGSIKSHHLQPARCPVYCRFNSTMVRLKGGRALSETLSTICFNSTMVRLKDSVPANLTLHKLSFQFHNGSI